MCLQEGERVSNPRYDWWPYVKGMIRRYPELCARERELHETSVTPRYGGTGGGHGGRSDSTAQAALRELPAVNRKELDAVQKAIGTTRKLETCGQRLRMVKMVYWDRTYTLEGAAMRLNVSLATAKRWNGEFIREVAEQFGLLER